MIGFGACRARARSSSLSARYLYRRDKHYIVTDGKVQIVDEYTGLVMADRSWEHGPHSGA